MLRVGLLRRHSILSHIGNKSIRTSTSTQLGLENLSSSSRPRSNFIRASFALRGAYVSNFLGKLHLTSPLSLGSPKHGVSCRMMSTAAKPLVLDKGLIVKMRGLGKNRNWKELNRIISLLEFDELEQTCLEDAREEQRNRSSIRRKGNKAPRNESISAPTSLFTDVLEAYMFRPSNENIKNMWSLLEKTRTDPTLAENIGIYRLLRIYKQAGINSVKGGRRNIRTEMTTGGEEKEVYLSSGQVEAMYMHLVEWLASASADNRRRYMFSLMKSGPDILLIEPSVLVKGVLFAAIDTLQFTKGEAETTIVARLVGDLSLTAFHALRTTGRTKQGVELMREALLPLSPQYSRAISEDSYSLAVSGCFRSLGNGKDNVNDRVKRVPKHRQQWQVDEESLAFLTSLAVQDNHPQAVVIRERLLQVLLSYGQYTRVKSAFETMLSSRTISSCVPTAAAAAARGGGGGGGGEPLILGSRAYMALVSAHAALGSTNGVLSALELLHAEKARLEVVSQEEKDYMGFYSLSGPSCEANEGCLPGEKNKAGVGLGADKFLYITAMDTTRQTEVNSSGKSRGGNYSFYDSLTAEEGKKRSPKRQMGDLIPRRVYQVEMARGLMQRLGKDGVQVDTRFLLQVAELGCDAGDFDLCVKAIETAHLLCAQGVRKGSVGSPFPNVRESLGNTSKIVGSGSGGTRSTNTTQTSRGSITLTTHLEDLAVEPTMKTAAELLSSDVSSMRGSTDSGSVASSNTRIGTTSGSRPSNAELSKIYGYAVLCARKLNRPEDCVMLLYYQLQMGITPTPQSINHVLKALFHADQHDEVLRIFKLMPRWGVNRTPKHAATMVDSLCRLGRLQDAYRGMSYIGPHGGIIRDDSRKSLLKQLCYSLVTNGRNDRGAAGSKFAYEDLLDAIAESCSDLLVSPGLESPTQKMRLARNFSYYMQGTPDDVLQAVVKRILLHLTKHGEHENEGMLAWLRKVDNLRQEENRKSLAGRGRKTKYATPPSKGVREYGER